MGRLEGRSMACSGYLAGVCRLVSMDLANFFITLGGLAGSANFGHLHLWFLISRC